MSEIYICITLSDGSVAHLAYQTEMRAGQHPRGPWRGPNSDGVYTRGTSDVDIEWEVARASRHWHLDGKTTVSWRRLSQAEHDLFGRDRDYRNAIEDKDGKIQHNMVKARELHRACLRHQNGDKFMTLDRQWVNASAARDQKTADEIEAKRKALRDFVDHPSIDEAQTIEELKALVPPEV